MANVVTATSGFDLGYPFKQMGAGKPESQQTVGGYYLNASQQGEPPGRWAGQAAEALGLLPGQEVDQQVFNKVYSQVHPDTGEQLGRKPPSYAKYQDHLDRLVAAEPHATGERLLELERQAARETRKSAPYTDITNSWSKSISVLHASIRENERHARLRGDAASASYWQARERDFSAALQRANAAGIEYAQRHAGITRTGYHGRRVDGKDPGKYETASLVVASFLQGSSRSGDCQDHEHNLVARMALTESDGIWRAVDTMSLRYQLPAVSGVIAAYTEAELSRLFGVEWVPRADGRGNEVKGISQAHMDAYSTRTQTINDREHEFVARWTEKFGREPTSSELKHIKQEVTMATRQGKDHGPIDMDKMVARWDRTLGGELSSIAGSVSNLRPGSASEPASPKAPSAHGQRQAMMMALSAAQQKSSTWTRADLVREMAICTPTHRMEPRDAVRLVESMTDRALSGEVSQVVTMEAPEWPQLPDDLRRTSDGRSVYTRPGSTRYSTSVQMSTEQQLASAASTLGGPQLDRDRAAEALGSNAPTLDAQLHARAQESRESLPTGLRLDQAAALHHVLTSPRIAEVLVGPAGSGKSFVAAFGSKLWTDQTGGQVIGVTPSQASRNVLTAMGMEAYNFADFLGHMPGERGVRGAMPIEPGTLIWIDEGSMLSTPDMADIVQHARDNGAKVIISGDQEQLTAVEQGGGMMLLAREQGFVQLAEPVRFRDEWERDASLRLRAGDIDVLSAYDEHGRIRGGDRETVLDDARRAYVAAFLDGKDVLLMAKDHQACQELSQRIRDDLQHLGVVSTGQETALRAGAKASEGDLIINRVNDNELDLANGDTLKVVSVKGSTVMVARAIDSDRETGERRYGESFKLPARQVEANCDLAYAITGHSAQGRTVHTGLGIVTGAEDRQWAYVMLTRGTDQNIAYVITPVKQAEPEIGATPAPEIDRFERADRERHGIPEPPKSEEELKREKERGEDGRTRDQIAVLSDILEKDGSQEAAIQAQRHELSSADHLGILNVTLEGESRPAQNDRYASLVREVLPADLKDEPSHAMTWLYRTLRSAEAAGLDAGQVLHRAVDGRSLNGARDHIMVINARIEADAGAMTPIPRTGWSGSYEKTGDPDKDRYLAEVAAAMDARKERLGQHTAKSSPAWALRTLGPVPEAPEERGRWEARAADIAAYRETYGFDHQTEAIGPEPVNSPEARALWHGAFQAMGPVDGVDVRSLADGSLLHMRKSYETETSWAPRLVGKELRQVRISAQEQADRATRADAEAKAAQDAEIRARHERIAESARHAQQVYREHEAKLEEANLVRGEWDKSTERVRVMALAADTEYRNRYPDAELEPLKSREPEPLSPEDREALDPGEAADYIPPAWLDEVAEQARKAADELADRQSMRMPGEDADIEGEQAWPDLVRAERDAVLQPPPPEVQPAPEVERLHQEREDQRQAGNEGGE